MEYAALGLDYINEHSQNLLLVYLSESRSVSLASVRYLVEHASNDVNQIHSIKSETPLLCAISRQNIDTEVVRYLLDQGASVDFINSCGLINTQLALVFSSV